MKKKYTYTQRYNNTTNAIYFSDHSLNETRDVIYEDTVTNPYVCDNLGVCCVLSLNHNGNSLNKVNMLDYDLH